MNETFEQREQRYQAARILGSNELLIWVSMERNESIPQTRRYLETIVAGLDPKNIPVQWMNDDSQHSEDERQLNGKGKSKGRDSLGSVGSPAGTPERKVKSPSVGGSGRKGKRKSAGSGA